MLQYPVSPRKAHNCFWVIGEGNWKIPCTLSEDSLLDQCVIWTPKWVTFVSTICALACETLLYPLSAKKFRTWIACCWALFSSGEQISRSSTYCNIFSIGPRSRSRRSRLRACPRRWGLSLNPWGNNSQSHLFLFFSWSLPHEGKKILDSLANAMQKKKKKASLRSKTVNHLALGGISPKIT